MMTSTVNALGITVWRCSVCRCGVTSDHVPHGEDCREASLERLRSMSD